MNNNHEEFNRLINELSIQKDKDRKHLLKIEIAKATDRGVKRALEGILADIEKKERRNGIIAIIFVIIALLFGFYLLGLKAEKTPENVVEISSSSVSQATSSSIVQETIQEVAREKNLSEVEVQQWVGAVLDQRYQNEVRPLEYELNVKVDAKDQLVYIQVALLTGLEKDSLGLFRINAQGELEESDIRDSNTADWIVVSSKFMDVSEVTTSSLPTSKSPQGTITEVEALTASEFAELFTKWSNSQLPIMHSDEYIEKYGHINEYDDTIRVIAYRDRDEETVQLAEQTPYRMSKFFYTYNNRERKAYLNRNDGSREIEFQADLTDFIHENRQATLR